MDTTQLLLIVIVIAVIVAIVFYMRRSQEPGALPPGGGIDPTILVEFPKQTGRVNRKVRISALPQTVNGVKKPLKVSADTLPTARISNPPDSKGIKKLVAMVIEPRITFEDGTEVYNFNPPLTIIVEVDPDDAPGASPATPPQLSIISSYQEKEVWRWQRWPTKVEWDKSTGRWLLITQMDTLHPADPVWEGMP